MKLKNAARYFDHDSVYDGYSGALLFKGQFSNYEGADPDGSFQRRRTVSVAPGVNPASRRVVTVQGGRWLMGELVPDTFKDQIIRQTTSAKEVTDSFTLLTPAQAALRSPTGLMSLYGHSHYLKDTVNSTTDSAYDPQYEVTFAITEVVEAGQFIRSNLRYLHIRTIQFANEGYWIATADEISRTPNATACEVSAVFAGVFDPVTETHSAGVTTNGIMMDMYKLYTFNTQADPRNQAGDMSLIVAQSAVTPVAGQEITIAGVNWRNIKFTPYHDAWNIQLRRA